MRRELVGGGLVCHEPVGGGLMLQLLVGGLKGSKLVVGGLAQLTCEWPRAAAVVLASLLSACQVDAGVCAFSTSELAIH